ncbi:MAG: hypothetical protein ACMXYA_01855, partial [Candidatus Woesearchaeota archaeon]
MKQTTFKNVIFHMGISIAILFFLIGCTSNTEIEQETEVVENIIPPTQETPVLEEQQVEIQPDKIFDSSSMTPQ